MNRVIEILREHIADGNVRFVFPSQTASGLWARKTCTLGIARSVQANRFLACDRFKEEVILEREAERKPASVLVRKIFAEALIRKNAKAIGETEKTGFDVSLSASSQNYHLKSLIPPEYAGEGEIFTAFIARLLPSLACWDRLMKARSPSHPMDAEDEDFFWVKNEYSNFLLDHGFFEPSWEEIQVRKGDTRYAIFFPELIEDFAEYSSLLQAPQFMFIGAPSPEVKPSLIYCQSVREEIRGAVMELRRIHTEEGIPYEDMAISVPELEEMEPGLLRELSLHHIPFTRRAGKMLGETGAGRLFSLAKECASSRFSFDSLKALILNDHIPWKEREKNLALINFGIKYNCVSGYVQNREVKDIWEEAFREASSYTKADREEVNDLRGYYRLLKKNIVGLDESKSFAGLRKCYFAFRGSLLDMEAISEEDNALVARCLEELGSLIDLEEKLKAPELAPSSPFGFFLACLQEKEYVRAGQQPGVNIFRWRVAAASPFSCHFVLNGSQSGASVLYQPLRFLRQDKRKALSLEDRDATAYFFLLCDTGEDGNFKSRIRISASAQTFSGWAIPHSFFAQGNIPAPLPGPMDPYGEERRFWKNMETALLSGIYPGQKKSFDLWKDAISHKEKSYSFFASPEFIVSGEALDSLNPAGSQNPVGSQNTVGTLLRAAMLGEDGCLTVTATRDLNVFYSCPISWLLERIFDTTEYSLEAALLDDTSLGLLYHVILQELFGRIKNEDRVFDSRRLNAYKRWAKEITRAAIKEHPAFKGPLAVPLVSPQAEGMSKKIAFLLDLEAKFFDSCTIAELELPVSLRTGDVLLKGVIDRVSISPDGEPYIFDYKTGYLPEQAVSESSEGEILLSEFQMPLYTKLCEEYLSKGNASIQEVQGAFFYSINQKKIKTVMGNNAGGRSKAPDRKEYGQILEAADNLIDDFAQKVRALDFTPREIRLRDCMGCVYKTICRTLYRSQGSQHC